MQTMELASLITYHRKQAGLSQMDLALHAGVSRALVQELEAGKERASWKNLQAVLEVLNVTLEPTGPLVDLWKQNQPQREEAS